MEDDEDGAALGGGEGGDGRVEVGVGWAGEGEWQVLVGSGVVGGVEEQADELSAIIGSGKKREKRGAEELWFGGIEEVEHGGTDRKDVASAIGLDPRGWKKTKNR